MQPTRKSKMDMISKLPIDIIETILCLLPIEEAARTSILSKAWRYRWIRIPKLEFMYNTFLESADGPKLSALAQAFDKPSMKFDVWRCKLFNAIYQVLLIHEGPIDEFTLRMELELDGGPCAEVDHILLHLSKKNTIKRLKLEFVSDEGEVYYLPISFSSLHQLTELYLYNCGLSHKRSLNGFGHLTTLYLEDIRTYEKTLLSLLSGCPLLKRLSLINSYEEVESYSSDVHIFNLFECLLGIEYLAISCYIVTYFAPEILPKVLPSSLVHLKHLRLEYMSVSYKYGLPFFALLIRSSPSLVKLKLTIYPAYSLDDDEEGSFTLGDYSDIMLEHLKELASVILNFNNTELDFVKFIFAKLPVLKQVRIFLCERFDEYEELLISELLKNSPRASLVVQKFNHIHGFDHLH